MTKTISGQVRRIIFRNEETGYVVASLAKDEGGAVTMCGVLPELAPGETIAAEGEWEQNPRHGRQFRIASYRATRPTGREVMIRYLGSGLISGIGPVMAKRIVDHFGDDSFAIIDHQPDRIREVPGIGKVKAAGIAAAWRKMRHVREIGMILQQSGAPKTLAPRLVQTFADQALEIMKTDPYRLVGQIKGIGFGIADRIAAQLEIPRDDPRRLRAGLLHAMDEAIDNGNTAYPLDEVVARAAKLLGIPRDRVDVQLEPLFGEGRLARETLDGVPLVTTPILLAAERKLAAALTNLKRAQSRFRAIDRAAAIAWVANRLGIALEPAQSGAVVAAIGARLVVITGGPGTGKTTIVRAICEIAEKMKRTVALCAPTGRAAKRLAEATGREAKTVHRLLEINPRMNRFERNGQMPIEADMVICDEASMLDVFLALSLAEAVAPGAHLIFVGDADQLPSVGPGAVLADLIACPWIATERLTHIFRQAAGSHIITGAHRIREGEMPELAGGRDSDFFFLEEDDPIALRELIVDLVARRLPSAYGLDPTRDIMVLAPMHRGEAGVAQLNDHLRAELNPDGPELTMGTRLFREGDKVMQTVNNYDQDIYNGDMGRITRVDRPNRALTVDFDGRLITFEGSDINDLAPAYAVSVHKSQGSEYPCVVAPLHTQHFLLLARNLLYTAVTRGKKLVILCGSRQALRRALDNDTAATRLTLLGKRLAEQKTAP